MRSLLALVIFGFALPAFAQPAAGRPAKIERLLELTKSKAGIDQMVAQILKSMPSSIPADAPQERRANLEAEQKQSMELIQQRMSWERMKPRFARLYEELFTAEEIDGIVAFYESPAGQSMLVKMPELMQRSMALGQEAIQAIIPELQRIHKEAAQ